MKPRILIAGLGNPGAEYEQSWHNVGFMALDRAAERHRLSFIYERRSRADVANAAPLGAVFVKPQTFMNRSGEAVGLLKKRYRLPNERIVIVSDDADLPLGTVRVRRGGSSGGHNGLNSIIEAIGDDFFRIRIGIWSGPAGRRKLKNQILNEVPRTRKAALSAALDGAIERIEAALAGELSPGTYRSEGGG